MLPLKCSWFDEYICVLLYSQKNCFSWVLSKVAIFFKISKLKGEFVPVNYQSSISVSVVYLLCLSSRMRVINVGFAFAISKEEISSICHCMRNFSQARCQWNLFTKFYLTSFSNHFYIINQLYSVSCLLCFREMLLGRIQQVKGLFKKSFNCKLTPIWGFLDINQIVSLFFFFFLPWYIPLKYKVFFNTIK